MNIKYSEGMRINQEFLDTIDFIPYLNKCYTIGELKDAMEVSVDMTDAPVELEGYLFNWLSEDEIADYIESHYPGYYVYERIELDIIYIGQK